VQKTIWFYLVAYPYWLVRFMMGKEILSDNKL
jgi:hypothetical protein